MAEAQDLSSRQKEAWKFHKQMLKDIKKIEESLQTPDSNKTTAEEDKIDQDEIEITGDAAENAGLNDSSASTDAHSGHTGTPNSSPGQTTPLDATQDEILSLKDSSEEDETAYCPILGPFMMDPDQVDDSKVVEYKLCLRCDYVHQVLKPPKKKKMTQMEASFQREAKRAIEKAKKSQEPIEFYFGDFHDEED